MKLSHPPLTSTPKSESHPPLHTNKVRGRSSKTVLKTAPSETRTATAKPSVVKDSPGLSLERLRRLLDSWLIAGDIARHSERTLSSRRQRVESLLWFLEQKQHPVCDHASLQAFFLYLNHGHKEPGGRWGNPRQVKPLSSGRVKSVHSSLRTFFNWCVKEGDLETSPLAKILPPIDRPDQIKPFTDDQLKALLLAAKKTTNPLRDLAILYVLLDCGLRASELTDLTVNDVVLEAGQIAIRNGKGGKTRYVPFSQETKRALFTYLRDRKLENKDEPMFVSERGTRAGQHMDRNGLQRIIKRIGLRAKISGVRCSPHTFRHSFAVGFLREGGSVFALKLMLGHESLAMVNRYVALSQADIDKQHRQFSPVARLKGGK